MINNKNLESYNFWLNYFFFVELTLKSRFIRCHFDRPDCIPKNPLKSQIKEKTSAARERGKESVKIHTDKVKVKTAAKKEQYKEKKEELKQKTREKTEELKEKTEKVRERARVENWYTVPNAMSAVRQKG